MKCRWTLMTLQCGMMSLCISCSTVDVDLPAIATQARQFSINDLRPAKVDVVEVRERDLKPLPTGDERAIAYERSGRRFAWMAPAIDLPDFETTSDPLPLDGSLLPSLDF